MKYISRSELPHTHGSCEICGLILEDHRDTCTCGGSHRSHMYVVTVFDESGRDVLTAHVLDISVRNAVHHATNTTLALNPNCNVSGTVDVSYLDELHNVSKVRLADLP